MAVGGSAVTGGIPSGRGPEASYLDIMTASSASNEDDDEDDDQDEYEGGWTIPSSLSPTGMGQSRTSTVPDRSSRGGGGGTTGVGDGGGYYRRLFSELPGDDDVEGLAIGSKDDKRTDVRNLLTQRSFQSFMFLLEQCRVS